jgi:PilZ domain-containing protein
MKEHRRHVRTRMPSFSSKVGRIVVDPKSPSIECAIIDISASGACLEVSSPVTLPKKIEFFSGGTKKKCNVVWKSGRRFGVAF